MKIQILRPDDFHIHLRSGKMLAVVAQESARHFSKVMVMPNLNPPVDTVAAALAYKKEIEDALAGKKMEIYLSLYLRESLSVEEIRSAAAEDAIVGVKLYPAGVTTNSQAGVGDLQAIFPQLAAMEEAGLVLQIHGEASDASVDIFDREKQFLDESLGEILHRFPRLKIVLEHLSTRVAAEFVQNSPDTLAATITPQHLLYNRNSMLSGGMKPHLYCLPILKREDDRQALLQAASSGNPSFFLGTDSAPHAVNSKETACACAGCFSSPVAMSLYTQAFEEMAALDKLEAFASIYGSQFYGLSSQKDTITLVKDEWLAPTFYGSAENELHCLAGGEKLQWKVSD